MASERVDSNQSMKGKPLLKVQIMVVDDDSTSLNVVSTLLKACNDQDRMNIELGVFTVTSALEALATLRLRRGGFDLVVSDLHMPGMNGMELQKHVEEEFKLPVIIMSSDDKESVMLRSLEDGAAFYIVKPVKRNDLKNVWQFAVAAKKGKYIAVDYGTTSKSNGGTSSSSSSNKISHQDEDEDEDEEEDAYSASSVNEGKSGNGKKSGRKTGKKRPKDDDDDDEGDVDPVAPKKAKVVWTNSLHNRFLQAISHIGLDKAVPKRILEFMSVPGLTRENVASHLQKYRMFLKRVAERGQNPPRNFSDRPNRSNFASSLTMDHIQRQYPQFSFQPQLQQPTFHPGLGFNPSPSSARTGSTLGRPRKSPYDYRASRTSFMSHSPHGQSRMLGSSSSSYSRPSLGSSNPLYRANPSGYGLESSNTRGGNLFSHGAVSRPSGLPMSATTNGSLNRENQLQRFKQENLERLNRLSIVGTGTTPSNFRFGSAGITRFNPVSAIGNRGTSNISNNSYQSLSANNNYAGFQVTSDGGLFESGAQVQSDRNSGMSSAIGNRGRISLLDWVHNDNSNIVGTTGNGSFGAGNYPARGSSSPPTWQRPKLPIVDQGNTSLLSPLPPSNSDMTNNAAAFNSVSDLKQRGTENDLGSLFEANNSNNNHFVTNRRQGGEGIHRTNNLPNISFLSGLDPPMTELLNSDFPAPSNFEANSSWTEQDTAALVQGGQAAGNTNSSGSATEYPIGSSYPTLGQGSGEPMGLELNTMFSAGNNNPTSGNTQGWGDEFPDSLFGYGPF